MNQTDKRERLNKRIAEDLCKLESMVPDDKALMSELLQLVLEGKREEARELLSLINRISDNLTRLEHMAPAHRWHDGASDYLNLTRHTLVAQAAALFVASVSECEAQR